MLAFADRAFCAEQAEAAKAKGVTLTRKDTWAAWAAKSPTEKKVSLQALLFLFLFLIFLFIIT